MRIGVTGAAGFLGSHVCERLLADGHEVLGVDAFTRFYARGLKEANVARLRHAPGFELAELNLLGAPALSGTLAGLDAVCHLAGRPGVRRGSPAIYEAGNVRTTEAVISAAARAGVRRVVLASSSSVYGPAAGRVSEHAPLRPLSHYGRSKRRAEQVARRLARRHGIELVILRYFTVYGPRQRPDMAFARFVAAAMGGRADAPAGRRPAGAGLHLRGGRGGRHRARRVARGARGDIQRGRRQAGHPGACLRGAGRAPGAHPGHGAAARGRARSPQHGRRPEPGAGRPRMGPAHRRSRPGFAARPPGRRPRRSSRSRSSRRRADWAEM